jgi:hypothetical protein
MYDRFLHVAREAFEEMWCCLWEDLIEMTPAMDRALSRLRVATAELAAWAQTSPVRVPGDFRYTPIGAWVQAVHELHALMDLHDDPFLRPVPPFEEWILDFQAGLAKLDTHRMKNTHTRRGRSRA